MSNRKTRIFVGFVIVLLIASITLMTMPINIVDAAVTAGSPTGLYTIGMPDLKPLPSGVTPQYTIETRAYLSFRPNPIGVGQSLLVNMWTSPGMYHSFYMCDYTVTIQKPDGSTETVGPMDSYLGDATAWFEYTVDQPGTWRLKFEQPGTYLPTGIYVDRPGTVGANYTLGASVYYTASSTNWQNLTVLPDMVSSYPPAALPTDYWTRPISPINREWWSIAGNYPWSGAYYYTNRVLYASNYRYTAYVQAPNTAHIVWKRQGAISGLIGGEVYQYSLTSGGGNPSIIYAGRCYQTMTKVIDGVQTSVYECYDLRTGEVYWDLKDVSPTPTRILYEPPGVSTVAGSEASGGYTVYLVAISGGRLIKYNPLTMAVSANVSLPTDITSGTIYNNEWVYTVQNLGTNVSAADRYRLISWSMARSSTNFTSRIGTNITWPRSSLGAGVDYNAGLVISAGWTNPPGPQWCIGVTMTSTDLYTGNVLWTYTTNDTITESIQGGQSIVDRGKIAIGAHGRHWTCFDGRTGQQLWVSEQTEYPWGAWWPYSQASYDFNESKGAIITSSYEGVYAIDWDDGKILWHYKDTNSVPFESPYDATPFFTAVTIADGKIYAFNGEHTPSQPISRDWKLHCINATTGELLWKITGSMTPGAVADGYLTASNSYDGYMYVFGKGKSATTVTAPDTVIAKGTGVVIKGTVLDLSPGQPNTPCVSKESMQTQMEYLHLQMPIDGLWHNESISGVPVTLTAIKEDGSVIDIGTTTTNGYYGTFSLAWTPPDEGTYTIMASFAGDDSYGSSAAGTGMSVGPAPSEAPPTATPTAPITMPPFEIYTVGTGIAVIIAIALAVLILRKRP